MSWILHHSVEPRAARRVAERFTATEGLLGFALAVALTLLIVGPIPQSQAYHLFHDGRMLLGVPNALNVLSNLPFVIIGARGLWWVLTAPHGLPVALKRAYAVLMGGTFLTGFGSAWYHLAPSHASLVWDRLPMVIAFAGLFTAVVGERVSLGAARRLLLPALTFGIASVVHWWLYDDLRAYVFTQFFPMVAIPLMLWKFPSRYSRGSDMAVVLAIYAGAKMLEAADGVVFNFGHALSGHTLKHFAAALAAAVLVHMLKWRRLIA